MFCSAFLNNFSSKSLTEFAGFMFMCFSVIEGWIFNDESLIGISSTGFLPDGLCLR